VGGTAKPGAKKSPGDNTIMPSLIPAATGDKK
jgi:hypothetical protein